MSIPLYSSVDDIQTIAIVAAIIREVSGGISVSDAVTQAREYLTEVKSRRA